jgi:MFS transporter, DHA2 family, multidrug resistance protein
MAAQPAPAGAVPWRAAANPWMIALSVMAAVFMVVLDSTVVNVSLPHIAGTMSAATEEATWVLTSYLVANAVILPATGWLTTFFGRKRLLMAAVIVFTAASALCGAAQSLTLLIAARVLQGMGGGAMQPISQAILLESFPPKRRGVAMAVYGMGVVVAPIIGPTLGGWITDNYSWRWVFYINLPVGMLALFLIQLFIEDPPYIRAARPPRIDFLGFGLLALWIGSLQIALDRGQQEDWLGSTFIRVLLIASAVGFPLFVFREIMTDHPLINLRVLKNRNFLTGTTLIMAMGVVMYGSTALLPLFLQTLLGYSSYQAGLAISPRGLGSIVGMILVGRIVGILDGRFLIMAGFSILAFSTWQFGSLNLVIAPINIIWPNIGNGFAMAFVFVPMTTLAMGTLKNEQMGNATGIYNLMRNLGGSVGIAMVTTFLARGAQTHQAALCGHLSECDPAFVERSAQVAHDLVPALGQGAAGLAAPGVLYNQLVQQATLSAYIDNFRLLAGLCLMCLPFLLLFNRAEGHAVAPAHASRSASRSTQARP